MFAGISILRRMKARFRRVSLINIIAAFLTLSVLFLFISKLSKSNSTLKADQPIAAELFASNRQSRLNFNKLNKFQYAVDNSSISDENQIDFPSQAENSTNSAIFRYGILGNYESIVDNTSSRPGDNGIKFDLESLKSNKIDIDKVEAMKSEYGMNMVASDFIPMDRIVPDIRHEECKNWHYPDQLPTASVVIVFHNEGLTTLVRTAHSVLLRSPRKLLKEVILLDDFSEKDNLKGQLEDYIKEHFGNFEPNKNHKYQAYEGNEGERLYERSGKVRLIRNEERQGLIRSRSRGASNATGDVIVFLDAHCEVNFNWLPPLLTPIASNRRTLTVPIIDGIDSNTFEYRPVYSRNTEHFKGIWEWGLLYKEMAVDMKKHMETHRLSEPYDSPTHAGGLFAIDRQFFNDLGQYDPGLLIWGGENFELSFKVWQCGGRLQWVPCSRVGHIYRPFMPYSFGSMAKKRKGPLVLVNYKRVVETWFDDEYKEYFYTREPLARYYATGDISKQLELKKKLQCKSFDWFMTNVASDIFKDFPKLPRNIHWGELRFKGTSKCLDTVTPHPPHRVKIRQCHSQGGNQMFRLNAKGQLATGERCIDIVSGNVEITYCKLGTVDGPWRMDGQNLIYNKGNIKNQCLTSSSEEVSLEECTGKYEQLWDWKKIEPSKAEE